MQFSFIPALGPVGETYEHLNVCSIASTHYIQSGMSKGPSNGRGAFLAILAVALVSILFATETSLNAGNKWDDSVLRHLARSYRERVVLLRNETMASKSGTSNESLTAPLEGIVILVTGSTSGIGRSLARWAFLEGATVVAMGRSEQKLESLQDDLLEEERGQKDGKEVDFRKGSRFFPIVADMSDLASVSTSVDVIRSTLSSAKIQQIDIVVCNAGMWHSEDASSSKISSKQGHELTFGVNYLSHFLLTEKLMHTRVLTGGNQDGDGTNYQVDAQFILSPKTSRVVQVSSSFHMGVDGTALSVVPNDNFNTSDNWKLSHSPLASRTPNATRIQDQGIILQFLTTSFLNQRQYANSKLAQLLQARILNRKFFSFLGNRRDHFQDRVYVPFVSACPGWVGTKIMRSKIEKESWRERLFYFMTYDSDGYGISSILKAMFDPLVLDVVNDIDDDDNNGNSNEKHESHIENSDYYPNQGGLLIWSSYVGDRALVLIQSILTTILGSHYMNDIVRYSRDILATAGCIGVMALQPLFKTSDITPTIHPTDKDSRQLLTSKSSTASYNRTLQSELYEWSTEAIADYL